MIIIIVYRVDLLLVTRKVTTKTNTKMYKKAPNRKI